MKHPPVKFVFDERSLEKISDIKEQGFMDIVGIAKVNNDVYSTAYQEGKAAGLKIATRLAGAIESYLDGETEGNVSGMRQAVAAFEAASKSPSREILRSQSTTKCDPTGVDT